MRNAFINTLIEEARRDESLWLLTGDIGFSVLEGFAAEFPKRFLNVGVAEQNMIGVAAGLALSGKKVFTYTIGNFSFMRCLEQIRNDVCYHRAAVTVVAVGGGFAYGNMGYTHHAIEDVAILSSLPYLTVCAPGDPMEAAAATQLLARKNGPGYLRLGRGGEPSVHPEPPVLQEGRALTLRKGDGPLVITTAGTLDLADEAVRQLAGSGRNPGLISMPVVMPFDSDTLHHAAASASCVVTVEEHGRGGLAALVAECLASRVPGVPLRALYARLPPAPEAGDRAALRRYQGLTVQAIVDAACA